MSIVLKFGCKSLINGTAFKHVSKIIKSYNNPIVVLSGVGDTTNNLKTLLKNIQTKKKITIPNIVENLHIKYNSIIDDLIKEKDDNIKLKQYINNLLYRKLHREKGLISQVIQNPRHINTHYICDNIISISEQVSCKFMSEYLNSINLSNKIIYSNQLFLCNNINSTPHRISKQIIKRNIKPLCEQNIIPIITSYYGRDKHDNIVRFNDNTSNLTAAYIADTLNISNVHIYNVPINDSIPISYNIIKPLIINKNLCITMKNTMSPNSEGVMYSMK